MNFYVSENMKVAVCNATGDVELVDIKNNIRLKLLDADNDMFGEDPTIIQCLSLGSDNYRIYYTQIHSDDDTLRVDTGEYYMDFSLADKVDKLYDDNINNMIISYPNPVDANNLLYIDNNFLDDDIEIEIKIYDYSYTNLLASYPLEEGTNPLDIQLPQAQYRLVIFMNSDPISSSVLVIQ